MPARVKLGATSLKVEPGGTQEITIQIWNVGAVITGFSVEVVHDPKAWATATPGTVNLMPKAEESVRILFAPPRLSEPAARPYTFGVRVRSLVDPSDVVTEEGQVEVLPFTSTKPTLSPQTSRGSRRARHDLVVENAGNVAVEVAVEPTDPNRLLSFETRPMLLEVPPGRNGSAHVIVRPNDTFLTGTPETKSFGVRVETKPLGASTHDLRLESVELPAAILQRPLLPKWGVPAGAFALLLAAGGVAVAAGILPPKPAASPSPSTIAAASPTVASAAPASPSPLASVAPSPSPQSPSPEPSASPVASPSPLPSPEVKFALNAIPTSGSSKFVWACADDQCQQRLISAMRFLATNLQETYGGLGLFGPTNIDPSSSAIPLVLGADGLFGWKASDGAGETETFAIDFAPLMNKERAYAVFEDQSGTPHRYFLLYDAGAQVFDMAFNPRFIPMPSFKIDPGLVQVVKPTG